MADSYTIIITQKEKPNGPVTFRPDVWDAARNQPAADGQPLGAQVGDNVTWDNQTDLELTLQPVPPESKLYLTCPIPARTVSSPIFEVPGLKVGESVTYFCKTPTEPPHTIQHRIVVIPTT
jgi:hypothetical protein